MNARMEELLYYLLWTAEPFFAPSWRNLDQSFEAWAWRNGLNRRLAALERQKLIERFPEPNLDRVVRLTRHGQCLALGGRFPSAQWSRPWDGVWRLIAFDIPVDHPKLRQKFRRTLRRHHFGYLQGSVWVRPDSAEGIRTVLSTAPVQADALLVIDGRPAAGESDRDIVNASWPFKVIHERYGQYLKLLDGRLPDRSRLTAWLQTENTLWRNAVELDPLLPEVLLPDGYRGREAYQRRRKLFRQLSSLLPRSQA